MVNVSVFSPTLSPARFSTSLMARRLARGSAAKRRGRIGGLEHSLWVGRGDELIHLRAAENFWQRSLGLGPFKLAEDCGDTPAGGCAIAKKNADRRQSPGYCACRAAIASLILKIGAEMF